MPQFVVERLAGRKDQKNYSVRSDLLLQSGRVMKGRTFLDWSGHCHATAGTQRAFRALTLHTLLQLFLLLLLQEVIILPHLLVNKELKRMIVKTLLSVDHAGPIYYLLLEKFSSMESLAPLETGAEHFVFLLVGLSLLGVGGSGGGERLVVMQAVSVGGELLEVVPVRQSYTSTP